jgi:hypothetical protein
MTSRTAVGRSICSVADAARIPGAEQEHLRHFAVIGSRGA